MISSNKRYTHMENYLHQTIKHFKLTFDYTFVVLRMTRITCQCYPSWVAIGTDGYIHEKYMKNTWYQVPHYKNVYHGFTKVYDGLGLYPSIKYA